MQIREHWVKNVGMSGCNIFFFTPESHIIALFFITKLILEFMSQIEYTLKAMINSQQLVLRAKQLDVNEDSE